MFPSAVSIIFVGCAIILSLVNRCPLCYEFHILGKHDLFTWNVGRYLFALGVLPSAENISRPGLLD